MTYIIHKYSYIYTYKTHAYCLSAVVRTQLSDNKCHLVLNNVYIIKNNASKISQFNISETRKHQLINEYKSETRKNQAT